MQLIVDTDTDISVPTKMSTIRQESLNEKFIDTSLTPNVCNDVTHITNRNDECVKNQEIAVKECEESVEAADQTSPHFETSQETIINDTCEEFGLCDKEFIKKNEYVKTENSQNIPIEHKNEVQDKKNKEIALDAPAEEENVIKVNEKELSKTENSQNDQIEHKNEVQDNKNNEITLDTSEEENVIKVNEKEYSKTENSQNDQIEHKNEVQDKKNNEITLYASEEENVIKVNYKQTNNSEMHNKTKQNSTQDCEFDKNELKKRMLEDEVKSEKQDNDHTQNDKIEAEDDMINSMIENKIEDQSNNDIENNVKDLVVVNNETVNKIEEQNHENFEMDISNEEQDKVDSIITSDIEQHQIKHQMSDTAAEPVKVIHKIEHKSEKQSEELIEMDTEIEEHNDISSSVKEDNIKEVIKVHNATEVMIEDQVKVTNIKEEEIRQGIEENNEMDITIEEQDNMNINVLADKIERQVEVTHEIGHKSEKQNVENMELDVIIEKQDAVDGSVAHKDAKQVEMAHKLEDKCEKQSEESIEMDVTNKEKGKVTSNDNIIEKVKLNNAIEDQVIVNKEKEDDTKEKSKGYSEMDVTFVEQDKFSANVTDDKVEKGNGESSETKVQVQQQDQVNTSVTKEEQPTNVSVLGKEKDEQEEPGYLNKSAREDKFQKQSKDNNETKVKLVKLFNENNEIQDKLEEQQNEISAIINQLEEKGKDESQDKNNFKEQVQNISKSKDKQSTHISVTKDITTTLDHGSTDNCKTSPCMVSEKEIDESKLDSTITISSLSLAQKNYQSEVISQEVEKHEDKSKRRPENLENKTKVDAENTLQKLEMQDSNEEKSSNMTENNTESSVTHMDTDEIIDIPDEKDDEDENQPKNTVTMDTLVEKAENALKNDVQESTRNASHEVGLESHGKSDRESSVKETNVGHANPKMPVTEIVEEKKKLTHISKLSNTLDILSDEEEDLPKEVPQKEIAAPDKEFTSINIDDDDDIMLIDEESSPKDDKNKTESTPEPINEVIVKEDNTVEAKEKKEDPLSEISENNKDTIQSEVATPIITEAKVSEPKPDLAVQVEPPTPKKPLLKLDFLKTCKKNLADMTRDELEEFCILKIVESVVDRSNLSEIKSQFKALAQNIEEYKKKASVLTKQNRDLQVVLKSVQEEQKKKSNMPITPLKITRSVGMQVLMTDKVSTRKKLQNPNTAKSNAGANSGPNRQGKTAPNNGTQMVYRKMVTKTTNNLPIPVPRLVPAINSSNLNNMKLQPSPANASGKSQVTGPVIKSPIQSVSNGLPAASPVQKPEKRPHSHMQQNDSVTVDLTDDEPPTKVISRNATPPVRLVPPQNLLAPNRQPFGQNVSSPRKVYIPISGSQTPVGVRPGQTIMLRTISPQGPRQRAPTPGLAKPNQSLNAVRMQRVPSRHPAPLPESVKQYQTQNNWKALPPAPELKLSKVENGIVISWKIDGYQEENYEEIASYQLYAYQETTSPPSTALWKKIGDVKALALPMACTLTQFMAGYKYYFAVRAVDIRSRLGPFSLPGSILLLNKM